ncbi:hypothetical protein QUS74_22555, partial [Xanthomonas citri pv. citri]
MTPPTGVPRDRIDGVDKVTGRATYAADVKLDGQLYAFALRSRVASGLIRDIDIVAAGRVPGVKAVYT